MSPLKVQPTRLASVMVLRTKSLAGMVQLAVTSTTVLEKVDVAASTPK